MQFAAQIIYVCMVELIKNYKYFLILPSAIAQEIK